MYKTRVCEIEMIRGKHWAQRFLRIVAACLLLGLTAQTDMNEPFGFPNVITSDGPLPTNWEDLQSEINAEQAIVAQCRGEAKVCPSLAAASFIGS